MNLLAGDRIILLTIYQFRVQLSIARRKFNTGAWNWICTITRIEILDGVHKTGYG